MFERVVDIFMGLMVLVVIMASVVACNRPDRPKPPDPVLEYTKICTESGGKVAYNLWTMECLYKKE